MINKCNTESPQGENSSTCYYALNFEKCDTLRKYFSDSSVIDQSHYMSTDIKLYGLSPQIRARQLFSLTFDSLCKAIAALFFIALLAISYRMTIRNKEQGSY